MTNKKLRKNIQLSEKMAKFVEEECEELGISQSGFINLCIRQYKDQQAAITELSKIQVYMDKLENLIAKEEK